MMCKELGCDGVIDETVPVSLQVSCTSLVPYKDAFACKKCGRLHWENGIPVFNRRSEKTYLINGKIEYVD